MLSWLERSKHRWLSLLVFLGLFFLGAWAFFATVPTEDPANSALGLTLLFSLKYVVLAKAADVSRVSANIATRVYLGMILTLFAFDAWLHWAVFTAPPEQGAYGYALYGIGIFLVIPTFMGYFILCAIAKWLTSKEKK